MKQKLLLMLVLFCLIFNTVSAFVWIYPGTDLISTGFTLNTRSAQNFTYVGVHESHANLSWGGVVYHNVSYADRVGSSEPLVELGKGYQNAGSVYTTVLNIDYYAPAGWTTNSIVCRPLLPYFLVCDIGWTDEITLPSTIWIYNESIAANDSIENFMQQAGVWEDFDMAIHYPSLTNYWKGHAGNTLHNITDTGTYYFKFFNATYIEIAYGLGPGAKITGWSSSQHNATHRRATTTYNPPNTIGVNRSWIGLNASITAYNTTLRYSGYRTFLRVFELFECKPPTNVRNIYNTIWLSVNMTWYPGNNTDSTVVVRNNLSYPTNPTDGYEVFNGTGKWHNETTVIDTRYYTVFGYNATFNCYSTGVNNPWGALVIWNVRNESNISQDIEFDILITNQDYTQTYSAEEQTTPLYLDFNDIPFGDQTIFVISNSSYKDRVTKYNTAPNHFYNYSFLLPPHWTPVGEGSGDDGGNTTTTRLYVLRIIDEYENLVEDVRVDINRYYNSTQTWEHVTTDYTGAAGEIEIYLIPNILYGVKLQKNMYATKYEEWKPDPDFYGLNYPKYFKIYSNASESNATTFGDVCDFGAYWLSNGTMQIMYSDNLNETLDVSFRLYEQYNGSLTWKETKSFTLDSEITWWNSTGLNNSRMHVVMLEMNHTTLGHIWNQTIYVGPSHSSGRVSGEWLENQFETSLGSFDFGWVNFFILFLPSALILLGLGAVHQPGLGIIGASAYLTVVTWQLQVNIETTLISIIGVGLMIGILWLIIELRGETT